MTTEAETSQESTSEGDVSVCDIMKGNTSEIIKKMEAQIPTYFQMHSDVYREFLHSMDDIFGTCFIAEKEFFDKLNFDQYTLKLFDDYMHVMMESYAKMLAQHNSKF